MQLPKAILFDMDGTILAAYQRPALAWRNVLEEFAVGLSGLETDALADVIDDCGQAFWRRAEAAPNDHKHLRYNQTEARRHIVETGLRMAGIDDPALVGEIATRFSAYRNGQIEAFPGALETIDRLRADGVLLALVTNGGINDQTAKIERFGLTQRFDHILISEQFGADKPDPSVYRHILDLFDCEPSRAWMVGDHLEYDVAAPQRLGIRGIWHDPKGDGLPPDAGVQPDRIIGRIPDLIGD